MGKGGEEGGRNEEGARGKEGRKKRTQDEVKDEEGRERVKRKGKGKGEERARKGWLESRIDRLNRKRGISLTAITCNKNINCI